SLGKSTGEYLLEKYPGLSKKKITSNDMGAIVAAAALAHDIGNPPFGHAGEEAISDFFKFHPSGNSWQEYLSPGEWTDMVNFEGNAQGFRMLVDKKNGLNISPATLAAFTKYPGSASLSNAKSLSKSQKKYGF